MMNLFTGRVSRCGAVAMSTTVVNGKYRMDQPTAAFFGGSTMHVVVRDCEVSGRFGRHGSVHGVLSGHVAEATWHDLRREGWISLNFADDYRSCICRFGLRGGNVVGECVLTKIVRGNPGLRTLPL
jgi:hypothetical protein